MAQQPEHVSSPSEIVRSSTNASLGAVDVLETADALIFHVDIPGLSKADVKVRVSDGNLYLSGERVQEATTSDKHYVRAERTFGAFSRVFKLPSGVDSKKIGANCDHGVLTVTVPKPPKPVSDVAVPIVSAEEEGDGSLNSEFAAVPISTFPVPALGKLVIFDSSMPIIDAVKALSQYGILAAPVRDASKPVDTPWSEKYLGVIDMTALVFHMLEKLDPLGMPPEDFQKEISCIEEFRKTTVGDAAHFARFGPFVPIDFTRGNLLDAMLLCGQHGIRRVPVVKTPGGDIVNIITQSALVQTLSANLDRFKTVSKCTLAQLGLATPCPVFSVTTDDKLRVAFHIIKSKDVSAVPVLDPIDGTIRGNVSARDVRLIASSNKIYKLLNMPLRSYLDVVSDGAENSAITCKGTDTMEEVIKRMVRSRIHRIYVVDEKDRVIRVVSLRNVLRKFVKEPSGYFGHFFEY
eukprot:m.24082 g.24082  ORF g.24082 m.24082 type:complete len:463 (+) comp8614_c0_seq1:138-1526(+)